MPRGANSPALDPVIMLDGRQPTLQDKTNGAILDHAHGISPSAAQRDRIKAFELTNEFFTSPDMSRLAREGTDPGLPSERHVWSPDIGRSAIIGVTDLEDATFDNFEAFKIPQLRGVKDTAPYFHDNSAKTLDDVMNHYARFFFPFIIISDQDKADAIAYMNLLR